MFASYHYGTSYTKPWTGTAIWPNQFLKVNDHWLTKHSKRPAARRKLVFYAPQRYRRNRIGRGLPVTCVTSTARAMLKSHPSLGRIRCTTSIYRTAGSHSTGRRPQRV